MACWIVLLTFHGFTRVHRFTSPFPMESRTKTRVTHQVFNCVLLDQLLNRKDWLGSWFLRNTIELVIVQPAIVAGFFEKLCVCANLFDAAAVHHYDLISR